MKRDASISACGLYRMQLTRGWESIEDGPEPTRVGTVGWILNNPSTADGWTDDNTVRKLWKYTNTAWGYGSMVLVNTNPHRSTDPDSARVPPEEVLTFNDAYISDVMATCPYVVGAWGDKAFPKLAQRAIDVAHAMGPLHALRVTKAGNPQHPLYLPGSLQPALWKPTGLH